MNTAIKRKNDNSPQRPPRSRDFVLLVAGQGISLFGNMMLRFAMSMWVLDETGSATIFASILAVSIVPTILLSPFGGVLADFQITQTKLAQMATAIDSAALLTYRAAWLRDGGHSVTKEAAMAKLTATENAQQVIDAAVQMFGGLGVVSGQPVESLYREIRALRIYEGASEVQQLIIGRELLKALKA